MELKSYQKKVIADLTRYLELLNETQNYMTAFEPVSYTHLDVYKRQTYQQ